VINSADMTQSEVMLIVMSLAYGLQSIDPNKSAILAVTYNKYSAMKMPKISRLNLNSVLDSFVNNDTKTGQWELLGGSV